MAPTLPSPWEVLVGIPVTLDTAIIVLPFSAVNPEVTGRFRNSEKFLSITTP